jgi:hypothetical protein
MNQNILFNDDLTFDQHQGAWHFTAFISGELISIYFHSIKLSQMEEINSCIQFDLEELVELWLEKNELQGSEIHIA